MPTKTSALDLPFPNSKTALMQHLQTLVLRGNSYWIGGAMSSHKLELFVKKMAGRYPITRDERGRTYDRSKGLATVHFLAYPMEGGGVTWWALSSDGKGGLNDLSSPDQKVSRHAMARDGHITFGDYVMLYAHKKDARTVKDARTGKEKRVLKDCSTWTWKLTDTAYNTVLASLQKEVNELNYGDDTCATPYGVRGVLAYQRKRPLFSGIRTQVLEMHRFADALWGRARNAWIGAHPWAAKQYGEERAGRLRPLAEITSLHLPKMMRFKVFTDTAKTLRVGAD